MSISRGRKGAPHEPYLGPTSRRGAGMSWGSAGASLQLSPGLQPENGVQLSEMDSELASSIT